MDLRSGLPMLEVSPSGANLQRLATTLIEAFSDRRVELYDDPDLKHDLYRLRIVEKSYGFRLESPRDASGHGDLGMAFALALLAASDLAAQPKIMLGGNLFAPTPTSWERRVEQHRRQYEQGLKDMYPSESEGLIDALRSGHVHFGQPMKF